MSDYTPTTEEVRDGYNTDEFGSPGFGGFADEFDRWLEAHDKEVAEKIVEQLDVEKEHWEYMVSNLVEKRYSREFYLGGIEALRILRHRIEAITSIVEGETK